MRANPQSSGRQRGAVVLTAIVLLLTLASLVTLYTGRVKSFESQITLNSQNHLQAFNVAEAGITKAFSLLGQESFWNGSDVSEQLPGLGSYTVSGSWQDIHRDTLLLKVISLLAVGRSADSLTTSTIQEQALLYPIVANLPDAPLIIAGGIQTSEPFTVAANPDGGGEGIALSIWSDDQVQFNNDNLTTCSLQAYHDSNCSIQSYSLKGLPGPDTLAYASHFPSDIFEYLFNLPALQWQSLQDEAAQIFTNCAGVGANSAGLLWVDGSCYLNGPVEVGSESAPVVLVVCDGDLVISTDTVITGLVFSFRRPTTLQNFTLEMHGEGRVIGSVVANHSLGDANGGMHIVHNAEVLKHLQQHHSLLRVGRVPGSWRDF